MGCKGIPRLEGSLTDNTEVGHVQVDLCMSLSCLFSQKVLVTAEAEKPPIMSSRYHLIHKRIQVRCEQSIRFLIKLVRILQPGICPLNGYQSMYAYMHINHLMFSRRNKPRNFVVFVHNSFFLLH